MGGVRMSRTPGGGSTRNSGCTHGKEGARGMGSQYSGGKNTSNTLSWKNPSKTKGKDGAKSGPMKKQPDNYYKLSRNPSGASNMPVRARDMDYRDVDL